MIVQTRSGFTFFLTLVLSIALHPALAAPEDDDLLLFLPAIISGGSQPSATPPPVTPPTEPAGLTKVKQLNGQFRFLADFGGGSILDEYYLFDQSTATSTADPSLFLIFGDSSLNPFFSFTWCDGGMSASYSTTVKKYLILCDWGFPSADLGNAFFFDIVDDTFFFEHFFYRPSTSEFTTSIPTIGVATRLSTSANKATLDSTIELSEQSQREQFKKIKDRLYAEHLAQLELTKKTSIARDTIRTKHLQQLMKKMLKLSN